MVVQHEQRAVVTAGYITVNVYSNNGLLRQNDCDVTPRILRGSSRCRQREDEQSRGRSEGQRGSLENGGCTTIKETCSHGNASFYSFLVLFISRYNIIPINIVTIIVIYYSTPVTENIAVTTSTFTK